MSERVTSKDTFARFFFLHIYERLNAGGESGDADMDSVLSYLESFVGDRSMDPSRMMRIKGALEDFAEYIVDNFLLPCMCAGCHSKSFLC